MRDLRLVDGEGKAEYAGRMMKRLFLFLVARGAWRSRLIFKQVPPVARWLFGVESVSLGCDRQLGIAFEDGSYRYAKLPKYKI